LSQFTFEVCTAAENRKKRPNWRRMLLRVKMDQKAGFSTGSSKFPSAQIAQNFNSAQSFPTSA